jgi:rhodanese-related sulfurtransferase
VVTPIDTEGVERLMAKGAQLVEVLPSDEYDLEHLPGAINIPLKKIDASAELRLNRHEPVIVYCFDSQ